MWVYLPQIDPSSIDRASLIILSNPNNPIGYTTPEVIEQLIQDNTQAIIAIDEIYGEFAPQLSVIKLLKKYKNLIIFRGFSKSYGLAGIRLGYILAHLKLIEKIASQATWSNVSYVSCGMAKIALDHQEYYEKLRKSILTRRTKIVTRLESLGFHIIPSLINTITIKFPTDNQATHFVEKLKSNSILVNQGEGDGKTGNGNSFVSFVVGKPGHMKKFLMIIFS